MRIALGLEYDGAPFCGWQHQPAGCGVEDHLESALTSFADAPVSTVAAGRTDAGVHARAQVVHFDTDAVRDEHAWVRGPNASLPGALRVVWARRVPADFHARYHALSRTYEYLLLDDPVAPALLRALTAKLNDATAWQIAIDEGIRLRAISARRERTRRQETGNAEVAERDRVDLIISGPSFVFAIENKTGTSEHDDQTKTYWSWISEFNCLRAAVFLSPYGGSASCEDFRPISYLDLLGMTLEAIAAGHATEHERIVLAMYARTLFAGPLRSESSIVKGASL